MPLRWGPRGCFWVIFWFYRQPRCGAYQLAIQSGGAALAAVLLYTAPAIVALLAWLFLREPMDAFKLGAAALTLLGVAGVSLQGNGVSVTPVAVFWSLLSALTYATYYLFGKLYLHKYTTPKVFLYALPVGALGLLPFVDFAPKNPEAWGAILFLTVVSTFFAITLYFAGLRRASGHPGRSGCHGRASGSGICRLAVVG